MIRWSYARTIDESYDTIIKEFTLDKLLLDSEMLVSSKITEEKKKYTMYNQVIKIAETEIPMIITIVTTLEGVQSFIQNYTASIPEGLAVLGEYRVTRTEDDKAQVAIRGEVQLLNNKAYIQDFIKENEQEIIAAVAHRLLDSMQ